MSKSPKTPRISPVDPADFDAPIMEILADAGPDFRTTSNIFRTLLRVPALAKDYRRFGDVLRKSELPARDREVLVMRTAWRCDCGYEWAQHAKASRKAGLSEEEIQAVALNPDAAFWSEFDKTLMRAADELRDEACLSEKTWSELSARYSDQQMIELLMLAGNYTFLSFIMNSCGVQVEDDSDPMPES